jgi:hypothetical protein
MITVGVLVASAVTLSAQAQGTVAGTVSTPADLQGVWRGYGLQTKTDTMLKVTADGQWTISSKYGTDTGRGTIKDGAFYFELTSGAGKYHVRRTSNGVEIKSQWLYNGMWKGGQVDATACDDACQKRPFTQ